MPEPITPTAATLVAATAAVPVITAFGVPLGLRVDVLMAGFAGAVVAMSLFDSVPSSGDTWQHLIKATFRRMFVALASSITAGYLTPMVLLMASLPDPLFMGAAFAVGGGAKTVLQGVIRRLNPAPAEVQP